MTKPVVLLMSNILRNWLQIPPDSYEVFCLEDFVDADAALRERGRGVRVVLATGLERLDAARLDLLPDLELISVAMAGYAGIDVEAARLRGIAITNAGDGNADDVADYAVALMLAHRRDLIVNDRHVREDRWLHARRPLGRSIAEEHVGIVGMGHIGQAIARRLVPFGCSLAWWGPRAKPGIAWTRMDALTELAGWASVLIVAARGNASSQGLIDEEVLAALGPDGLIVNVSRGFVIDEAAMIARLRCGMLGGAALDVFTDEPLAGSVYADVPNLIMAPHVAGASADAFHRVMAGAVDNVRRLYAGEPLLNRVV